MRISRWLAALLVALPLTFATAACASPGVVVVRQSPPRVRVEARPARPGPVFVWQPGHWTYRRGRYVWTSGRWVRPPRGKTTWVAGRWVPRRGGWVWIAGRWR